MTEETIRIGVIGGSGLYQMSGLEDVHELRVETPFGDPSDALIVGQLDGVPVAFLPRHGRGHVHTPSEVPYRANIYALKSVGVEHIISVSACGSLRERMEPCHIVVPDQLFDFTKDRKRTYFEDGLVAHVSVADPFCDDLSTMIADAVEEAGGTVHRSGAFITIEGPRFSTKAESETYRAWGMDIIGMTTSPEAFLAREAGICYGVLAHITDYDVWHESEEPVTVDIVIPRLNANIATAKKSLALLIPRLARKESTCDCAQALKNAVITARDRIPDEVKERLDLIVGPYL